MRRRPNVGNVCHRTFKSVIKNIKIEICRNIILIVFLYVCKNWSPKMGEKHAEGIEDLSAEGHVR
jgi:hypothetical protein